MNNPLARDLDRILEDTRKLWDELRGQQIFITGGTGFFGCWLLESFVWANARLGLNASAVVLTRDADRLRKKAPHLVGDPAVQFHQGDIRDFDFPDGEFSHIIHAATAASAKLNEEAPLLMLDTIVQGARRALEFAISHGAKKFLLTSSGAVYGRQPGDLTHVREDYVGAPDPMDPGSAYAEGKRTAELLCATYCKSHGLETKIARCFTFVGPYLPLDLHYAVGNFIRDGLNGRPIRVKGDGTPVRSYLYAADLATWLWTILFRGEPCRPYNVGSEGAISIAALAELVGRLLGQSVEIRGAGFGPAIVAPARYVPSTHRSRTELGLGETADLADAIRRTAGWRRGGRFLFGSPEAA